MLYEVITLACGPERRWAPAKRELFANMHGRVLFVAVGTGQDIRFVITSYSIHYTKLYDSLSACIIAVSTDIQSFICSGT